MSRAAQILERFGSEIFEMANLTKRQTGLDNILYISTKQGQHGPRVKYYKKPGSSNPSAVITISGSPELLEDSLGVSSSELKLISEFIVKNKNALLKFWYKGDEMTDDEVTEMKNSFIKVN